MEFSISESSSRTSENDVLKMVHKFKNTFQRMLNKENQPVIESDYDKKGFGDEIDNGPISPKVWYGSFDDPAEQTKCKEIACHIEEGLKLARERLLKCEILIPCGLTMRVARDILIMSESEPCGVRGCSLTIHLQEKTSCTELVKAQCDPNTVPTFEIHLTLQEDTRNWVTVKKMMMTLTGCFKNSIYRSSPKMLCLGYKLEKQKLYRASC